MAPAAAFPPSSICSTAATSPFSNTKNRELLLSKNPLAAIPKIPLLAIKGSLCFRCFSAPAGPMISCPGCHRANYCSDACRRWDWDKQHGAQCSVLRLANKLEEMQGTKSRTWEEYSNDMFEECQKLKGHADEDVTSQVTRLVGYQPYCSGCHRSAAQIPYANLRACGRCRMVFTCGSCTISHSEEECETYKQISDLELFRLRNFEDKGSARCTASTFTPRNIFTPLSSAATWLDYFGNISDKGNACSKLDDDLSPDESCLSMTQPQLRAIARIGQHLSLATESMSIPMTILAALEETMDDLLSRSTLSIHLVGASTRELGDIVLFEELLHLLPALKHIELVLAGPEVPGEAGDGFAGSELVEMDCCEECTSQGRRRTCRLFRGVYHDFAKSSVYKKPDLAVLFHSGRSQEAVEGWRPTTRFLVHENILTLCTTYTEREAKEETRELEEWGVQFLVKPEVNRWKSVVPILEVMEGQEHQVYYVNYYRYVFRGMIGYFT